MASITLAGVPALSESSGVVSLDSAITFPAGHILQIVEGTKTTQSDTSSTSFVNTGLNATITPASTSNKIFIMMNIHAVRAAAASQGIGFRITRNDTALFTPAQNHNVFWTVSGGGYGSHQDNYLDSPSSTSALTYRVQFAAYSSSNSVIIQQGNSFRSSITLMEIQG